MQSNTQNPPDLDTERRFVRVVAVRENGLIEFLFAIGEPELCAELVMPKAAFDEFCSRNKVVFLKPETKARDGEFDWNLHDATHTRFRAPFSEKTQY
jgi:phenol/toluene 2-monooxygenase (NADH) P0/A0